MNLGLSCRRNCRTRLAIHNNRRRARSGNAIGEELTPSPPPSTVLAATAAADLAASTEPGIAAVEPALDDGAAAPLGQRTTRQRTEHATGADALSFS